MKSLTFAVLLCCILGFNRAQLTSLQVSGAWVDDGTNTAINAACCLPVASIAAPLVIAGPTSSTMSAAGTWGTSTGCTTLGLNGKTLASTGNTLTSASSTSASFPIPFAYTYTFTNGKFTGTTSYAAGPPIVPSVATLTYTMSSTSCSQALSVSGTAFDKTNGATFGGTAAAPITYTGTPATDANCCYPNLSGSNNIQGVYSGTTLTLTWTWDTTSTNSAAACLKQGLSGTATATLTAFTNPSFTLSTATVNTGPSTLALTSATVGTWTYVANGQSCPINLKKSTSSASQLILSVAGFMLLFVAHL